jgi:hypothetical protein
MLTDATGAADEELEGRPTVGDIGAGAALEGGLKDCDESRRSPPRPRRPRPPSCLPSEVSPGRCGAGREGPDSLGRSGLLRFGGMMGMRLTGIVVSFMGDAALSLRLFVVERQERCGVIIAAQKEPKKLRTKEKTTRPSLESGDIGSFRLKERRLSDGA